ncbi:MAG: amino acid adenylation domain-containing protein, partial [Algicola sp.]|nr:amino acid adenylation domain-containing protein [Algicola sp.]
MGTIIEKLFVDAVEKGIVFDESDGKLIVKGNLKALSAEDKQQIKEHKSALIALIKKQKQKHRRIVPIEAGHSAQTIPLSFSQQRMWLLDQIEGGNQYNIAHRLEISGVLDVAVLNQAFTGVIERHASLRTGFHTDKDGNPYQLAQATFIFDIDVHDVSDLDEPAAKKCIAQLVETEAVLAFNLNQDLMLRASLIKMSSEQHLLLLTMHHIAADGWSMAILIDELSAFYYALVRGEKTALPPLEIQYSDFASWQRNTLKGELLDQELDYWVDKLADLPVAHNLPLDRPRSKLQSFAGHNITTVIGESTSRGLSRLCQSQDSTLFMGLFAAFSLLLSRYSNQQDIVMGTSVANREQEEIAGLIGCFINTLVLRCDLSQQPDFITLIKQCKQTLLGAYSHQQAPFEMIVERLQPQRSLNHSPLFQVMLVLHNNQTSQIELPELTLNTMELDAVSEVSKFDLTLNVSETDDGLILGWEYNTDLFDEKTIVRMARHFEVLLTGLVNSPEQNAFTVNMLDGDERHQLFVEFNQTNTNPNPPQPDSVIELFQRQVEITPNAVAAVYQDITLSYLELNQKANNLAHYLVENDITIGDRVGIYLDRSLEMLIGVLGVMKSGATYVPLEAKSPSNRIKFILEDADIELVLTSTAGLKTSALKAVDVLMMDNAATQQNWLIEFTEVQSGQNKAIKPDDIVYILYTSGSTGHPKGVMVPHKGVINYLNYAKENYLNARISGSVVCTSLSFDATITTLLTPLCVGKSVELLVDDEQISKSLFSVMTSDQPRLFKLTPAHLMAIEQYWQGVDPVQTDHMIVVGGEQLKTAVALAWKENLLPQSTLINEYGPTETVVGCSTYVLDDKTRLSADTLAVPIGKPISNTQLMVLGQNQVPVGIGMPGELYIGGAGVATGYLNRDDLSQSAFIANPFYDANSLMTSERLYKTGDLVRWLPQGDLVFLGRIDHQVKIRGFRIELGEIEHTLAAHHNVSEIVVLSKVFSSGDMGLVAYIVNAQDIGQEQDINSAQGYIDGLRRFAAEQLPEYMVPAAFVLLSELPLTANGKIDHKALPAPDMASQQSVYVAPRTDNERQMCEVWQQVLGLEQVGIHDNFFELGGHSLLVIKVISRLQVKGVVMTAQQIFATPTLAELVVSIEATDSAPVYKAPENLIPHGCEQITPEMLPLVTLDEQNIAHITSLVPGGASNIQDIYPLGPLQEGILFHHMMSTQGDPYVMPMLFEVKGEQAVSDFLQGMKFVISRHDILRTAILWDQLPVAVQVVCREVSLPVTWLEAQPGQDIAAHMQALCAPEVQQLNLTVAPLLAIQVMADPASGLHYLLVQFHHLITDHVGLEIIQQELDTYQRGEAQTLAAPMPFREFIAHTQHQAEHHDAARYFSDVFGDIDEPTLSFNLTDVQGDGSSIVELREAVPLPISRQLRAVAKKLKVSPAALFHTAWAMLIGACSGRDDVVFGTVVSGRLQGTVGAQYTVGVFINTLPFRVKLSGVNVTELVKQVQSSLIELLPYEQASLVVAQQSTQLPGDTPLYNSMLNFRHSARADTVDDQGRAGADVNTAASQFAVVGGQERTNFPFNLSVDDLGDEFGLDIQVDSSLDVQRINGYMQTVVAGLVDALSAKPQLSVANVPILPHSERQQVLQQYHATPTGHPAATCVHQAFEAQVARAPLAIAVEFEPVQLS